MSILVIPNTFVTGTTINAAPFNGNFSAVATAVNSVDNTQIGVAGIFASQIIPTTTGQATFGGSVPYTFATALTSTVPGLFFSNTAGATTGNLGMQLGNSGGTNFFGIESSVGGTLFTGSSGYATVFGTTNATALQFGTSDLVRLTITSAGVTYNSGIGTPSSPSGTSAGDIVAQRTASEGLLLLGGATEAGVFDFGYNNAHAFTLTGIGGSATSNLFLAALTASGTITAGAAPGPMIKGGGGTQAGVYFGNSPPGGVVSAPNGSIYLNYGGGANAHLYVNTSGASSTGNTWTAVTD